MMTGSSAPARRVIYRQALTPPMRGMARSEDGVRRLIDERLHPCNAVLGGNYGKAGLRKRVREDLKGKPVVVYQENFTPASSCHCDLKP